MKRRSHDGPVVILALGLLLLAGLYALLWPQGDFSASERRLRAAAPAAPSLSAWKTDREVEQYISDRIPFRQALVGADAAVQACTGRRTRLAAWPVGNSLVEPPVSGQESAVKRRLDRFGALADGAGASWYLLVPPTHGSLLTDRMNPLMRSLYRGEESLTAVLEANPHFISLAADFAASPDTVYYRTDHHWTLEGAYLAYARFCAAAGREALPLSAFRRQSFPGFLGTTASRSGFLWRPADTLDCAEPAGDVTLTVDDDETVYHTLLFPDQASGWDGYAVYLNGNHGRVEILNPSAPAGTLLVFRDSYGSCLLPLLSASYSRVVAVDARYWSGTFSDVLAAEGADDVLFCYSLDSLANDTSLARKAK